MFIEEVRHIMNETRDTDQWTGLGLGLVCTRVSEKQRAPILATYNSPS